MKWESEQEEREITRKEDKEDERVRRVGDKAKKCRERRFSFLQTMLCDHKSAEEIREILSMLL